MKWLKEYVDIDLSAEEYAAPHDHDRHGGGGRED